MNTNSDTLSRYPLPNLSSLSTTDLPSTPNLWNNCTLLNDIKNAQYHDSHLRPIIDSLSNSNHPFHINPHPSFTLINGILHKCRLPSHNKHHRPVGREHLIVIPKSIQHQLLAWVHDHPTAGHGGREKDILSSQHTSLLGLYAQGCQPICPILSILSAV